MIMGISFSFIVESLHFHCLGIYIS